MNASNEYISQLLKCDIYDTESVLQLRADFFQLETNTPLEADGHLQLAEELDSLSEKFWDFTQDEFKTAASGLLVQIKDFAELKKHLLKLFSLNNLRSEFQKIADHPRTSKVFMEDVKSISVLRGKSLKVEELRIFENIKNSRQQTSVLTTVKIIRKDLADVYSMHEDWFEKILQVKSLMQQEKKTERSGSDWFWIVLGIYFLFRIIGSLVK